MWSIFTELVCELDRVSAQYLHRLVGDEIDCGLEVQTMSLAKDRSEDPAIVTRDPVVVNH